MEKKLIVQGVEHRIIFLSEYFILFPITNIFNSGEYDKQIIKNKDKFRKASYLGFDADDIMGHPDIDIDSWNRPYDHISKTVIRATEYMKTSNISYENMKYKFYYKYKSVPIEYLPTSVELYGLDFHLRLVEEAIVYAFNILVNPTMVFSELHEFYFKMLYFYNSMDLILFADNLTGTKLSDDYKKYITKSKIKMPDIHKDHKVEIILEDHQYNAFLMSSVIKSTGSDTPFNINRLNKIQVF